MPDTSLFSLHAFMSINLTLILVYRNVLAEKAMIYTGVQITHMSGEFLKTVCVTWTCCPMSAILQMALDPFITLIVKV